MQARSWDDWLELIDWPAAIRGAGTGFGVLVIASLLRLAVVQINPWLPLVVLLGGFLLGFVLAARGAGDAPSPALTGAVAAFFAYTLTLPLLSMTHMPLTWSVLGYCAVAALVGGLVGHLAGRRESASD